MWKDGKDGPLPCMVPARAVGVRGMPSRLYGGREPWMGWGSEAAAVPMADRDCGCWKPEKPEVVVTQELRERLSEAVNAEPAGDMGGVNITVLLYNNQPPLTDKSIVCLVDLTRLDITVNSVASKDQNVTNVLPNWQISHLWRALGVRPQTGCLRPRRRFGSATGRTSACGSDSQHFPCSKSRRENPKINLFLSRSKAF